MEFIDEDGVVLTRAEYRAGLGKGRVRQVMNEFEPSIVDESKRDDTDLNVLVKRWMRGEPVPQFAPAQFGDVSDAGSFMEVQERLLRVEQEFSKLPAYVREHFNNSPVEFADALADPTRGEEFVSLGLFSKREEKSEAPAPSPKGEDAVPKADPPADKPA